MRIKIKGNYSGTFKEFENKSEFKKWVQKYIQDISFGNENDEKLQGKILENKYVTISDMLDLISGSFKAIDRGYLRGI